MAEAGASAGSSSLCYQCKDTVSDKWITCVFCKNIAHTKCANVSGIKHENLIRVKWLCDICYHELSALKKFKGEMEEFKNYLKDINSKTDDMIQKVDTRLEKISQSGSKIEEASSNLLHSAEVMIDSAERDCGHGMWAEVVKKKKKQTKKNLLVVTGTEENPDVREVKNNLSNALDGIQITDTKFTNSGKIVMNFADETLRNEAAQKISSVEKLAARPIKKMKPKITLCNVHKEESKESLKNTIITRNEYLQTVPEVQDKIEIIFDKPAAGGTIHYILRCDPIVRELIHKNSDKIKLEWGVYQVRDRYHAIVCYYCQRYGHTEGNCTAKKNGDSPNCFKCGGNHRSKECNSTERKCINCIRYKKEMVNHLSTDYSCPILISEIDRIRNITDHGY